MTDLCKEISSRTSNAINEASVVSIFELELFSFIKDVLGLRYYPEKEKSVSTERHISKGRIDSKIGALVIEFKHTSKLESYKDKEKASNQLKDYLNGLYEKHVHDYLGLITDGTQCKFIHLLDGILNEGSFDKINWKHLDTIIKNIVLLDKIALTPDNLVKDFCNGDDSLSKQLTLCLYSILKTKPTGRSLMLFNEWKELFRLAHDDKSKQKAIEERRKSLERIVGKKIINNEEEYLVLYALQTTYAIIVKIIAYKVISKIRFNKNLIDFNKLSTSNYEALRLLMNSLEEGAIFRKLGIGNLLEGDFFAWYSTETQWNSELGGLVQGIFKILTNYEDKALFENGENVNDLFKDLFLKIIPDKVRHSLGEYYTPPWLADNLIVESIKKIDNKNNWTAIDPCAGSGTFLTVLIKKVLEQTKELSNSERLHEVLTRVKGIDLNPLAVLTARINYFINISPLISDTDNFEIPVYLGDSSYAPTKIEVENISCVSYKIKTIKGYIDIVLPLSAVSNSIAFSKTMTSIETDIHNQDADSIVQQILKLVPDIDKNQQIISKVKYLADQFVDLEKNDWNGIWARIVTNFLTTANLGKFDLIVGNPPWIDWKNLPEGYRERIKSICIDRHLFSGDGMTGGINLNVCALIANVTAQNWLDKNGILALLMPQTLVFQQSYEGFRNFKLDGDDKLYFQELYDWTKSGNPFFPVTHKFLSYFFSRRKQDYSKGIPLKYFIINKNQDLKKYQNTNDFEKLRNVFTEKKALIGQANSKNTIFSYVASEAELKNFSRITGDSTYVGRDGIDFYPQELFLMEIDIDIPTNNGVVYVKNFQATTSQHKIPENTFPIETKYLYPLVRSTEIKKFHLEKNKYFVPFPYEINTPRNPISGKNLSKNSPLLAKYFYENRTVFNKKTSYNKKIMGSKHDTEFYSLTRVGEYTYADYFVVFRKDTKWCATVVSKLKTPWGDEKQPRFQSHAVSISQNINGKFILLSEAHFICSILNSSVAEKYIINSSDSRSFKVRPQIYIPQFEHNNIIHKTLSDLSIEAHDCYNDTTKMKQIIKKIDDLVINLKS